MVMNLALPLEKFEGHRSSYCKRKVYLLARGVISYDPTQRCEVSCLLCVARGPFLAAAAMVIEVVVGHWPLVAPCLRLDKPHSRNSRNLCTYHIFLS